MDAFLIHAGDDSVRRSGDQAAFMHLEHGGKQFLILPVLLGQGVGLGGKVRILQREDQPSRGHLLILPGLNRFYGAGVSGDPPGAVEIQRPGTQSLPLKGAYSDRLIRRVALILHSHHHNPLEVGLHLTGDLRAVLQGHGHVRSHCQIRLSLQRNRHQAVQVQQRQAALPEHHLLDAVPGLGIDLLHPASGFGGEGGIHRILGGAVNLLLQILHGLLHLGDGVQQSHLVHHCQGISFRYRLAVFHQEPFNLHPRGEFHFHRVPGP